MRWWKKIVLWTTTVFAVLIIALAVHVYIVTHPRPMDIYTRAMARIDIQQSITQADADSITAWLYRQKGVDRVMVNPTTAIAVFTFFPIKTSADRVVGDFQASMPYKAQRFMPTAAGLKNGCPAGF